jgi:hypothetical protein
LSAPPFERKASTTRSSCSSGCATVIRASAQPATQPAVSAVTAAPTSSGGRSGRVQRRASETVTWPWWETVSPAHSSRMMSAHSRSRSFRWCFAGQPWPVMCSFISSPDPIASQKRPGYITSRVAAAWAMIAGW